MFTVMPSSLLFFTVLPGDEIPPAVLRTVINPGWVPLLLFSELLLTWDEVSSPLRNSL